MQVIYDKLTGRSRGFGFVTMSSKEAVEAACQQFNGYVNSFALLSFLGDACVQIFSLVLKFRFLGYLNLFLEFDCSVQFTI